MTLISQGAGKVGVGGHCKRLPQIWSLSFIPLVQQKRLVPADEGKRMAWVGLRGGWKAASWISAVRQPTTSWL